MRIPHFAPHLEAERRYCLRCVPAVIQTPILDQLSQEQVNMMLSKIPLGRTGKPDEVAALVHYLASPDCSFTTGQCLDISGGRATSDAERVDMSGVHPSRWHLGRAGTARLRCASFGGWRQLGRGSHRPEQ